MHIAVVNQFYSPVKFGGAELSVQMLCEALVLAGHKVTVITTALGVLPKEELINGVIVWRLKHGNIYTLDGKRRSFTKRAIWHSIDLWNPWMFVRLLTLFYKAHFDIVHTNCLSGISCSSWKAAQYLKIPVVHTLRDFYLLCLKSSMFKNDLQCFDQCISCFLTGGIKRLASQSLSGVVGISNHILKTHRAKGLFRNVPFTKVIPNSTPYFIKDSSFITTKSFCYSLGFLGRLHPSKGLAFLLRILLRNNFCGWKRIHIAGVGSASYESELHKDFNDSRIVFEGHTEPALLFRKIDLLVVPSLWEEPFGRVVVEAYAHGIPVLASNRGGLSEIVHKNRTGYLFDPSSEESLANTLTELSRQPSVLNFLRIGAFHESRRYNCSSIAAQYADFFSEILVKNVPRS
jgi:glycosyltransferase involved in cell wall biosynthesis